jgi:tryptophanase
MGGALVIRRNAPFLKEHPQLLSKLRDHQILTEGHPTYGGISGRDLMVITAGLPLAITEAYLNSRIGLVQTFGEYLQKRDLPVLTPFGGHAVYIDMNQFFADTHHRPEDFGGIALTALLLLKGVRLCELGNFAFGSYDPLSKTDSFPQHNFVRCAIPRNKYELQDLYYVADCIAELHSRRHQLPCAIATYGRDLPLRHFKARFDLLDKYSL